MNDKFMDNNRTEKIEQKINRVAEQTNAHSQFAAELEERLRDMHRPKTSWFADSFKQVSPVLRWVALMILLGLVLSLSIKMLIPAPQPATNSTPVPQETPTPSADRNSENQTAVPDGESYDYDGGKLIMTAPLPDSPGQANVYALIQAQPATADYTRTLANQFGIDGEMYMTAGHLENTSAFMVTDGKQQLIVYANNDYTYTSDLVKKSRNPYGFKNENAEALIREYLKAHHLEFNFTFNSTNPYSYLLAQVAPDGLPMQYAYNNGPFMSITLDEDGGILDVYTVLMNYDAPSLGQYRIINAEEALGNLLNMNLPAGQIATGHGPLDLNYVPPKRWFHDYPDNQTVTMYGELDSDPAADTTKPAIVFIDNVPAIGNTSGMDGLNDFAYVQATGQFVVENGIRKFNVETWKQVEQATLLGSAHQEGDQILIDDQTGSKNVLADPPADLMLDLQLPEALYFRGAVVDGTFHWASIEHIKDIDNMGGGGGGGGMGFYPLNLSGTPVPFPTTIVPQNKYTRAEITSFLRYTVQEGDSLEQIAQTYNVPLADLMSVNYMKDSNISPGWQLTIPGVPGPTRLDGERGIVQVQTYEKPDGRQRTQYTFASEKEQIIYELKGNNLEALQKIAYLPIKIWGSLSFDEMGNTLVDMEKFEVIYPDLQFQVLSGTQEIKEINGEQVVLFTTDGVTYVELVTTGGYPDMNYSDANGVTLEVLQIPGETYAGYPALRVFSTASGTDPYTGKPYELTPTAGRYDDVLPDPYGNAESYIPPDTTIDKVELVYVVADSYEMDPEGKYYIQPAWHFHGYDTTGNEVDILVQALEQEYLLPETQP